MLMRSLAAIAAVSFVAALSAGCGGLGKDESELRCNQERAAKSACFNDTVYAACEDCFMRCGDECIPQSTCPATYLCPDDKPGDTTGSSSTGGS